MREAQLRHIRIAYLAAALALALLPAHALALSYEPTGTPGLMRSEEGEVAFADTLASGARDEVAELTMEAGERHTLAGDFSGGWGDVTVSWESVQGDVALALSYGVEAADDLVWQPERVTTLSGVLPRANAALTPRGRSQTVEIVALAEGVSAWRLVVTDETGLSHSACWLVRVGEEAARAEGPGLLAASADEATTADTAVIVTAIARDGDGASAIPATDAPAPASSDPAPPATPPASDPATGDAASEGAFVPAAGAPAGAGLPTTGDLAARDAVAACCAAVLLVVGLLLRQCAGGIGRP